MQVNDWGGVCNLLLKYDLELIYRSVCLFMIGVHSEPVIWLALYLNQSWWQADGCSKEVIAKMFMNKLFIEMWAEVRDLTTNRNTQEPITGGSLCTFSPEGGRGRSYFQNLINHEKRAALRVEKQNLRHTEVCIKELGGKILGFPCPSSPHYNFVIPVGSIWLEAREHWWYRF